MKTIRILAIDTGHEPHAIRAAAECWGASVSATWVGNSREVVDCLSRGGGWDLLIISGHGTASGLLLPELAPEIRSRYPYAGRITPRQFRDFVRLGGCPVVNLSCGGGARPFANAFLTGGAGAYIGPKRHVDGSAALMYVMELVYGFLAQDLSLPKSHKLASSHPDDRRTFTLHEA